MRLLLLLLFLGTAVATAPACDPAAIWALLSQTDVLVQLDYRFSTDGQAQGVGEALGYYAGLCANNSYLPFYPLAACAYLDSGTCARALNGSVDDTLRVSDALLRYRSHYVSGYYGCPDILAIPVVDDNTGLASCVCPPNTACIVSSSGATVNTASVDEPTAFFLADYWLLLVVMLVVVIGSVALLARAIVAIDRFAERTAGGEEGGEGGGGGGGEGGVGLRRRA